MNIYNLLEENGIAIVNFFCSGHGIAACGSVRAALNKKNIPLLTGKIDDYIVFKKDSYNCVKREYCLKKIDEKLGTYQWQMCEKIHIHQQDYGNHEEDGREHECYSKRKKI